ncbi:MAG: selenocysteine-specific translation elongation factor [Dehalococcoidia bacterium]|jgi:selenocysteine-specific elongation factor|nr:selenocysteine-specific translation elongation factor [Chloroflexota bacterium]MDP5878210.1 selenocysteine-specific translation elongation factor [Dehalococcoidia bacterium]MDP6273647.1 selenocysteine-specific translation elongation factor [Dehalococcoidia bacterium]
MFVIGTAGHVDHGKSTLIEALTGIDPDRLREEKERGMTIELGFAWLTLPGGREVSIIDVPGHERFIKTMLMGAGGVDLALLIVAAEEGVMPQTREHLAILDLLGIERGIVALTKSDLVEPDWVELVTLDIQETLAGTSLDDAPVFPVSALTGVGLEELLKAIDSALDEMPDKRDLGRPRLPVDRSFTISGFGTVVTGTLVDGTLRVGQEVELLPEGLKARIRGLQTHQAAGDLAFPGTRVAVNLGGVSHDEVSRGDVLTTPGWLSAGDAIDVSLRLIPEAPRSIRHNATVTFHVGAAETPARIRLLAVDQMAPGDTSFAQIKLQDPMPVVKDDPFVIRDSNHTLGGGVVLEAHARRHRRKHQLTLDRLETLRQGSESDILSSALATVEPATASALAKAANIAEEAIGEQLKALMDDGLVVPLGDGRGRVFYSSSGWTRTAATAIGAVGEHHGSFPLRQGIPREELRSRLEMRAAVFNLVIERLVGDSAIEDDGSTVRVPGHSPEFDDAQEQIVDGYLKRLSENPYSPPTDRPIDPELVAALAEQGVIVRASEDVVFLKSAYDHMLGGVRERAAESGQITITDVREMFGTSRKYTLALLEHLDRQQITRRVGDERVLR